MGDKIRQQLTEGAAIYLDLNAIMVSCYFNIFLKCNGTLGHLNTSRILIFDLRMQ